jgi:uncharacterized protein
LESADVATVAEINAAGWAAPTNTEDLVLHQVHWRKLAADATASVSSLALIWAGHRIPGLIIHVLIPAVASAVLLPADTARLRSTRRGKYMLAHMRRPVIVIVGWSHGLVQRDRGEWPQTRLSCGRPGGPVEGIFFRPFIFNEHTSAPAPALRVGRLHRVRHQRRRCAASEYLPARAARTRAQWVAMTSRDDVRIPSDGEQLAAYVYRPSTRAGSAPCVVMAHGFSATRDDGLPAYAEAFRDAGFVVILFDYRHFGASSGQPRQLLDIGRQHDDYRAVVTWARRLDGVDPDRIVLFGSSFSGGHVLALAAADPRIAAVISQAPFTDAIPTIMLLPMRNIIRLLVASLRDQAGAWLGRPPVLAPAVGEPGTYGAMTAPEAKPGFDALVGSDSKWRNEFAARLMLTFPFYRPGRKAVRLTMPLLMCVCDADATTPAAPAMKAAQRAPRAELRRYPYGHFDIYHDPQVKADQVAFLHRVIHERAATRTADDRNT